MLISKATAALAAELGGQLSARGLKVVTAESCTGGAVGSALTSTSGSSRWYEMGYITYSNAMKVRYLDVPEKLIERFGVVSEPVVKAMLQGAVANACADVGIAISGIAGPGGAVEGKPVGTVCMAWGFCESMNVVTKIFAGDRDQIRESAVQFVLKALSASLEK